MSRHKEPASAHLVEDSELKSVVGGRVNYFNGRFLAARDLADEQSYHRKSAVLREHALNLLQPAWSLLDD